MFNNSEAQTETQNPIPTKVNAFKNFARRDKINLHLTAHEKIAEGTFGHIYKVSLVENSTNLLNNLEETAQDNDNNRQNVDKRYSNSSFSSSCSNASSKCISNAASSSSGFTSLSENDESWSGSECLNQSQNQNFSSSANVNNSYQNQLHITQKSQERQKVEKQFYALKIVFQDPDLNNRELSILELLRGHSNIIHLIYSYYTSSPSAPCRIYLNLVTELLHCSLYDKIYNNFHRKQIAGTCSGPGDSKSQNDGYTNCSYLIDDDFIDITLADLKSWFRQVFVGLDFMHEKNICHRDIKPENICFDFGGVVKIIDFGSAKILSNNHLSSPNICTLLYRAPELIYSDLVAKNNKNNKNSQNLPSSPTPSSSAFCHYSTSVDIWSTGCVMFECLIREALFCQERKIEVLAEIIQFCGLPTSHKFNLQKLKDTDLHVISEFYEDESTLIETNNKFFADVLKIPEDKLPKSRIASSTLDKLYNCLDYQVQGYFEAIVDSGLIEVFERVMVYQDDYQATRFDAGELLKLAFFKN